MMYVERGLKYVREFFPSASVGEMDKETEDALYLIGLLDHPNPPDIITFMDRCKVGVWGGAKVGKGK